MFELIAHTADVRFRVESESLEGIFCDSLAALADFMRPDRAEIEKTLEVAVESTDTTTLLIDFLNEVLTRSHLEHTAYDRIAFESLTPVSLRATVTGRTVREFGEDVKAVTYHEAEVVQRDGIWSTMLVFDI